jgi:aryl-alcohol dehydrogenase-like predicted oxidoreductase
MPPTTPTSPTALTSTTTLDRRTALQLTGAALIAATAAAPGLARDETPIPLLTRPIPSTGERLPVIGLGTNRYNPTTDEERANRKAVLAGLTAAGAKVIDTAPSYGESERVIGELLAEIGNRDRCFLATKVTARGGTREEGEAMLSASRQRLRSERIDLIQVHNLVGTAALLPLLREEVAAKRIRYLGITTSRDPQYAEFAQVMSTERLDFVQVDYSIANRGAAERLLPLAADRGMAVLVNMPFGGPRDGNLFGKLKDRPLPSWAAELDAASWGQALLKYILGHPAVTCVIPGMTRVVNLQDNLGAGRGRLPDAALRQRMEQWWDAEFGGAA